jgi:hypothetical protein
MTEHDDVIRLLREGRPQATEVELDEIKQRVRRRAAAPSGRKQSMKSRVAILAMLVTGMVFSTAGAGLALSGSHNNASIAQYATPTPTPMCTATPSGDTTPANGTATCTPTPEGGVLPASASSTPTPTPAATNAPGGGGGGVAPAEASNTQPVAQQEAASNSTLPFTGFAAIPVILGGLALLSGGLVLRRKTREE